MVRTKHTKKHDENIIEVLGRIWHFFFMTVKSKKKKKEQFYLTKLLYKNDEGHRHYFTKFRKKSKTMSKLAEYSEHKNIF